MDPTAPPPLNMRPDGNGRRKVHKPLLLVTALLWRQTHGPGPIRYEDLERILRPVLQLVCGTGDREAVLNPFWRLEADYWTASSSGRQLPPARASRPDRVRDLQATKAHAVGELSSAFGRSVEVHGCDAWITALLDTFVAPYADAEQARALLTDAVIGDGVAAEQVETAPSVHAFMQWQLLTLSKVWGYTPWVNPHDANTTIDVQGKRTALSDLPGVTTSLPVWLDAGDAVGRIDVIWLETSSRSPREMFEVENSTSIHSGILRMSDFLVTHKNLDGGAHIVVPPSRLGKALAEAGRPTFRKGSITGRLRVYTYPDIADLLEAGMPSSGTPREALWARGRRAC